MKENHSLDNWENAMRYRHEERKDIWYLPDEVLEGAIDVVRECYESYEGDARLDYDNLALNAEIVRKEDAKAQYDKLAEELEEDALFVTENFIILSW